MLQSVINPPCGILYLSVVYLSARLALFSQKHLFFYIGLLNEFQSTMLFIFQVQILQNLKKTMLS